MRLPAVLSVVVSLVVVIACGEEEAGIQEPSATAQSSDTATVTPSPTAHATPSATTGDPALGTIVPPPSPLPTPVVIPADWVNYSDPNIASEFRYPSTWHQTDTGTVFSFDPRTQPNPEIFPPGGVKVQLDRVPGPRTPPAGATETTLDGRLAWETVRLYGNGSQAKRVHTLVSPVGEFTYVITAFFQGAETSEEDFLRMLSSVQLP